MRRNKTIPALALALALLAGCGAKNAAYLTGEDGLDIDLTRLSGTMVYAEVYNMRYEPEPYYGKTIRIEGLFSAYQNPETGERYYNCVIPDATACCSQGLQFFPDAALVYPDDFPENGTTVTVRGVFEKNEQNLYMCCLTNAVIESAA